MVGSGMNANYQQATGAEGTAHPLPEPLGLKALNTCQMCSIN